MQFGDNGLPVYAYDKDVAARDVVGQGVGKVWRVIGADGTANQVMLNWFFLIVRSMRHRRR